MNELMAKEEGVERELKPLYSKIIFKVRENPYLKKQTDAGIWMPDTFKNSDSDKIEQQEQLIVYGDVLEVGSECTEIKPGDGIFVSVMSCYHIPFYDHGYQMTDERNVLSLIR